MSTILEVADFEAFDTGVPSGRLEALIEDAEARALWLAPCLAFGGDEARHAAARGILRRAILRAAEQGSGGVTTHGQTAGAFSYQQSYDTRGANSRGIFYPAEEDQLRELCDAPQGRKIRVLRTRPTW